MPLFVSYFSLFVISHLFPYLSLICLYLSLIFVWSRFGGAPNQAMDGDSPKHHNPFFNMIHPNKKFANFIGNFIHQEMILYANVIFSPFTYYIKLPMKYCNIYIYIIIIYIYIYG